MFLFDHFTRSYCGNLFTWPSSQSPKVDSVLFLFLFPVPGWVPSIGRCSVYCSDASAMFFWHWHQGTWLCSLCTAQTCLGVGVSGAGVWRSGAAKSEGAFLSHRHNVAGLHEPRGGHLLICTAMLYRLVLFLIGRANQPL